MRFVGGAPMQTPTSACGWPSRGHGTTICPWDNIDRAIKKASGDGGNADDLLEVTYEGYGPGGAA